MQLKLRLVSFKCSPALFYQSTLLARPLVVPHKHQEQPYMLTAKIHASQALQGRYQHGSVGSLAAQKTPFHNHFVVRNLLAEI